MSRVLYFLKKQALTAAVVERGKLCEYIVETEDAAAERIVLGKVVRIVPALKAAFVNIGQDRDGFLPLVEGTQSGGFPALTTGMDVLVQIKKDARAGKGAFLTRDISLCGQYVLYMPMDRHIGISARIKDGEARQRLTALGEELTGGAFGVVFRSAALDAPVSRMAAELEGLRQQWVDVEGSVVQHTAPSLVYQPRSLFQWVLDDYLPLGIDQIYASSGIAAGMESAGVPITVVDAMHPQYQRDLADAQSRFLWLKNGGSLLIDEGEACTMIDVNTAKLIKGKNTQETALRMNLEAIPELVRQIRLRNLSGIILIDFINMAEAHHRHQVKEAMEQALQADRVKTVVHGFTSLGLLEMTRKRTRNSLRASTTTVCAHCHGDGRIPIDQEVFHG